MQPDETADDLYQFEQLTNEHALRQNVRDEVRPPGTTAPSTLPFNQRSPEDFERICVVIAEYVDGLRNVRLYGLRGQKQGGIDLVGFDREDRAVVYQARRWVTFSARDLRIAVEDYANGKRPFEADRFVVCVSSVVRRTDVIDELTRLQRQHDFEIDLYDEERLSEMLKSRGDLVRRLFGEEWDRLFCTKEKIGTPTASPADVLADAILRSPLDALGLTDTVERAKEIHKNDSSQGAVLYRNIAEALEQSSFAGFAENFRYRQADALIESNDIVGAIQILADMGWKGASTGNRFRVREVARRLEELPGSPQDRGAAALLADVFNRVDRWYADPLFDVEEMASSVVELMTEQAAGAPEAVLWLAESAIVSEQYQTIEHLLPTIESVTVAREARSESDELAVRLRVCLAEATGDWNALIDKAQRGRLGPRQATLVHARHGRYLAWNNRPEAADKSYRLAIDQACQSGLNSEAAEALHSIWIIGARYGLSQDDWFGALDLARNVRLLGGDYLLLGYDRRASGVGEMADGKLSAALPDLRSLLRTSVIAGRLSAEIDAHSLLGKLYARANEPGLSVRHYIRAGDVGTLEQLLPTAEAFVDCTKELSRQAPWEQAAVLAALAAEGDFIPDAQVSNLARLSLEQGSKEPRKILGPTAWLSAYKLLAAIGPRLPRNLIDPILDALEPQIHREENQYHYNDKEHVQIVAELFEANSHRLDRVGTHLLALLAQDFQLGHLVLRHGLDALRSGSNLLQEDLRRLATDGVQAALDALLYLEVDHPLLLEQARERLETTIHPPERKPGEYSIGSDLPRASVFVRLLPEVDCVQFAEAAMKSAEDTSEMEINRTNALEAVMIIASSLPGAVKTSLFDRAILLGTSPTYSEVDEQLKGGLHPLSAFHINMAFGSLVPQAVRSAASLAATPEQYQQVVQAAASLFRLGDAYTTNQATHAMAQLPPEQLTVDVAILAGSPDASTRQLAAILWVRRPGQSPELGDQLAADPNSSVRRVLAGALGKLEETSSEKAGELRAILSRDPAASVRASVS